MAQTEHLPIYKATYDCCLYFEQLVRNFPRYHKYSIGQDLRDGARRVLKLIVRANARGDKSSVLLEVREEVEQLKVLLRLCHDAKGLPNPCPVILLSCFPRRQMSQANHLMRDQNPFRHGP
jgi:hypothetical protein